MSTVHVAGLGGQTEVIEFVGGLAELDGQGRSCGHYAVERNHLAVLTYLAEQGADLAVADSKKATMAHLAAYFGHAEVLALLLKHAPGLRHMKDSGGSTPEDLAAGQGHSAALQVLRGRSEL